MSLNLLVERQAGERGFSLIACNVLVLVVVSAVEQLVIYIHRMEGYKIMYVQCVYNMMCMCRVGADYLLDIQ